MGWGLLTALFGWAGLAHAVPPKLPEKFFGWRPFGQIHARSLWEASGIDKSDRRTGIFWTHNDSGHAPHLFAINTQGELVAEIPLRGAVNIDWEDIAVSDGLIYVGDIGGNTAKRAVLTIYVVKEPDPRAQPVQPIDVQKTWRFTLPGGPVDCEAMFVHRGRIHIITKESQQRPTLYRLDPDHRADHPNELKPVVLGTVPLAPVTAADITADGKRLAVISYGQLAVFDVSTGLDRISILQPKRVAYPINIQTEGCTFDGAEVVILSESGYLWRITAPEISRQLRSPW